MSVTCGLFHAHLDQCEQCRNNPFGLCPEGSRLLTKQDPTPPDADPVQTAPVSQEYEEIECPARHCTKGRVRSYFDGDIGPCDDCEGTGKLYRRKVAPPQPTTAVPPNSPLDEAREAFEKTFIEIWLPWANVTDREWRLRVDDNGEFLHEHTRDMLMFFKAGKESSK